jgi:hypothetical protein
MKKLLFILPFLAFGCKTTKPVIVNKQINKFEKNICRGNGQVVVLDSTKTVIRIKGILIKNDSIITSYRYILAFGSFNRSLREYDNKEILFECEGMIPNNFFPGEDILSCIKGCIETEQKTYNYTSK